MAGYIGSKVVSLSTDASDISGNITVGGTVDGRDVATDGTKLDGVEASATADQTKADIEGLGIDLPAANLTGTVAAARLDTATTQAESDDSTKIATTAYVVDKITTLIGGAPSTLNDLNELAAAINDDANYNSTLTTALATKLPLAGGTLTGDLTLDSSTHAFLKLDKGASGDYALTRYYTAGTEGWRTGTYNDGTSYVIGTPTDKRLLITTDGNVGIGTSPATRLNIEGTWVSNTGQLAIDATSGTQYSGLSIRNNTTPEMLLYHDTTGNLNHLYTFNDPFTISVANQRRMTLDTAGNVGIGSTSPTTNYGTNLNVHSAATNGAALHLTDGTTGSSNNDGFHLISTGGLAYVWNREATDMVFATANTPRMTITSGGAVTTAGSMGVGVTPSHPLSVNLSNGQVAMFGSNGMNSAGQFAGIGLGQVSAGDTTYQKVSIVSEGTGSGSYISNLHFLVNGANGAGSAALADSKMMIKGSNGYVGIGTSSPDAPLKIFQTGLTDGSTSTLLHLHGQFATGSIDDRDRVAIKFSGQNSGGGIGGANAIKWSYNQNLYLNEDGGNVYVSSSIFQGDGHVRFPSGNLGGYNQTSGNGGTALYHDNGSAGGSIIQTTNAARGWSSMYLNRFNWASGSDNRYMQFTVNGSGAAGYINIASASTVTYGTSSDYRLKENVVYDWDATTRLKQLKPARFNFILDGTDTTQDGFMAHEAQEVVPLSVSGTKDAMKDEEYEITPAVLDDDGVETEAAVMGTRSVIDPQSIDHSMLVPLLVKTIQELEARITALEA